MIKDLFSNRLFIGALAFFILTVGGSLLYMQHVKRQTARELAAHKAHLKQFTEKQKPTTAKAPVGDTSQGGHFHADGTWHAGPHEIPSDETIESDAEFKARVEKNAAEMAAAKTARERNAAIMRRMETSPYFETFPHLFEDMYNFYKAHPNFDHETASPELNQKWVDAVYAQHAKMSAHAEQMDAQYVPLVEVDKRPRIYTPNGTIWLDEGGNR